MQKPAGELKIHSVLWLTKSVMSLQVTSLKQSSFQFENLNKWPLPLGSRQKSSTMALLLKQRKTKVMKKL